MPFKVTTTIGSGSNQMVTSAVIESPQRIMLVTDTRSVISLDSQCYEKTGAGAWQTCTSPATGQTAQAAASSLLDQATIDAAISIIQSAKLTGNETLNGINARIYEYTSSGQLMGMQVDSTSTLWVDEKTGLPIKVVANSTVGGSTTTYTQLITYDPTIKVQAP
jgi:outer membrane lipoprotein-sorting protein